MHRHWPSLASHVVLVTVWFVVQLQSETEHVRWAKRSGRRIGVSYLKQLKIPTKEKLTHGENFAILALCIILREQKLWTPKLFFLFFFFQGWHLETFFAVLALTLMLSSERDEHGEQWNNLKETKLNTYLNILGRRQRSPHCTCHILNQSLFLCSYSCQKTRKRIDESFESIKLFNALNNDGGKWSAYLTIRTQTNKF